MPTKAASTKSIIQQATAVRGQGRRVVIPKAILDASGLREGDSLNLTAEPGKVLMEASRSVDPDDVLTPADAKKVRHALKQIKEGKTRPWNEIKNELDL
jgi:bifunctional DNA-binding transcriptional regulator/antitoxin component of YhaV-PrlF toxin-antitoxin module